MYGDTYIVVTACHYWLLGSGNEYRDAYKGSKPCLFLILKVTQQLKKLAHDFKINCVSKSNGFTKYGHWIFDTL